MKQFLSDFAAQSRLLIVIPLLILGEPLLAARMEAVARHFIEAELIKAEDLAEFEKIFTALWRRGASVLARIVVVILIYCFASYALGYFRVERLPEWGYAPDSTMSGPGYWYIFVALPLMFYFLLGWVWRLLAWSWFLRSVSRLDLRLVPSHPDLMGGLGFLQTCLRGYLPLCFAIGTIVAGGVANRVVHLHQTLSAYVDVPAIVILIVLILCVAPFLVFVGLLWRTRGRGILEYGSLASGMGHVFESKWLGTSRHLDRAMLEKPDFSSTIDLFSVVAYAHQMKLFPVGLPGLAELAVATLIPAIPIALLVVPFHVILESTLKVLF